MGDALGSREPRAAEEGLDADTDGAESPVEGYAGPGSRGGSHAGRRGGGAPQPQPGVRLRVSSPGPGGPGAHGRAAGMPASV